MGFKSNILQMSAIRKYMRPFISDSAPDQRTMPVSGRADSPHSPGVRRRAQSLETAINRRPRLVMFALAIFFLLAAYTLACVRPFWFDEFITIYIAKQGSLRAIWNLLSNGADPNPPLSHLLVLASIRFLGSSEPAIRTPFIFASLIGILCLFEFLRKYVGATYAAAGVCFYITTHAFDYAFEARSYALLLCFSMLSLIAWRWSIESRHPTAALLLMTASLGLSISSNYYGVLALFPIAAGELTYFFGSGRRRIRWQVWLSLAVASASLFLYLPLINASVARFAPFAWNKPTLDFLPFTYTFMLDSVGWLAAMAVYGALLVFLYEWTQMGRHIHGVLPRHEFAVVAMLLAYPFLGYSIAVLRSGMISARFVIPFVFGVSIAVAVSGYRLFRRNPVTSMLFLLCCVGWCVVRVGIAVSDYHEQRSVLRRMIDQLPNSGTLAVPDSLLVLPLHYYSPPQVASRIVFPMDILQIRNYKREDSSEQNLIAASQIYPVPLVPLQELLWKSPDFYIVAPPENWLLRVMNDYKRPAEELPKQVNNHSLRRFFSLSFGDCLIYREHFN